MSLAALDAPALLTNNGMTAAGDLVTFGSGESGRLGHGSETDTLRPCEAALFTFEEFCLIMLVCLVLNSDNSVFIIIRDRGCVCRHGSHGGGNE